MKRTIPFTICMILILATTAYAGIAEFISTVKENGIITGLALVVILYLFKIIPNEKIYNAVRKTFKGLGVAMTLGFSKYPFSKPLWNKTIEPWFIDMLSNTVLAAIDGFIAGLKSDDTNG